MLMSADEDVDGNDIDELGDAGDDGADDEHNDLSHYPKALSQLLKRRPSLT